MKILRNFLLIILFIAALVSIKYFYFPSTTQKKSPEIMKSGAAVVSAIVLKAEKLTEQIFVSGTILANEEVNLTPEMAARVVSIHFKEGQGITKGQILVKLNDAEITAQMAKLKEQLKLAVEKESRAKQLVLVKGISQDEYEISKNQLNNIETDIRYLKTQLDKTEIRAPFSGTIGLKGISVGSYVNTSTSIASLQQLNPLKIEFAIPEKYAHKVKVGSEILFSVDQSKKEIAKIYAIEPKVDINTHTLKMRAIFTNQNQAILPGVFVNVEIPVYESDTSILIPNESIIPELKGKKVFLSKSGKAFPIKIETGIRNDLRTQVTKGLLSGDTLIISGIQQLKPDMAVKITVYN